MSIFFTNLLSYLFRYSYGLDEFELYIIFICKNQHQQNFKIKNFEQNEKCGLSHSLIENKQYEYNLKYNKYINCTKRSKLNPSNKFIKVNIENENIITDGFKNFLNNFNLIL